MTHAQKIKMALALVGMSQAELATKLGTTPQAFSSRMKTDKFTTQELIEIAAALGATYDFSFNFPNGNSI